MAFPRRISTSSLARNADILADYLAKRPEIYAYHLPDDALAELAVRHMQTLMPIYLMGAV